MKYILIGSIVFIFLEKAMSQEDKTRFGIKSGMNLSRFSISQQNKSGVKTGFHIGIYVKTKGKDVSLRPELYFSSQGQKSEDGSVGNSITTEVNYVNVPILLETSGKVNVQVGPQIGMLISAHETGKIGNLKVDEDVTNAMRSPDFSVVLGLGFSPGKYFNLGARYHLGLSGIFEKAASFPVPDVYNRVFHFYLATSF